MSTYTYIPLVGMSSKCDNKNDITYYIYDNVGRLKQVQDQNRKILKDYQYNYISYAPTWTDNGTTYCVQGQYGNTGEQMMQQTDNNPYSGTYQQTRYRSLGVTGNCPLPPNMFVMLRVTSTSNTTVQGYPQIIKTFEADIFSDAACTVHYNTVSALTVNYSIVSTTVYGNGSPNSVVTNNHTVTIPAGSNSAVAGTYNVSGCVPVSGGNPNCTTSNVDVTAGTGYYPITGHGN
jgi:hypothetical protein